MAIMCLIIQCLSLTALLAVANKRHVRGHLWLDVTVPPHDDRGNTIAGGLARRGIVPASLVGLGLEGDEDEDEENKKNVSCESSKESLRPPFTYPGWLPSGNDCS